jgi:hypothetical protein
MEIVMNQLVLRMDKNTEDLWQYVSANLDDSTLDEVEVERDIKDPSGLASEPVTSAIILALSPRAAAAVLRVVEKWMEAERQREQLEIVLRGFSISDEAGKSAASLAAKHAEVSIKYGPPALPTGKA